MCPYKTVLPFGRFLAVLSPLPHHKKILKLGKILDTRIQRCFGGEGNGWA